ncbi:MAG: nucleotidyltransferase family protein [Proteobacteria bacterium]|nr:nucleotidyltransferase family protein [Pseudomonadota bacterium]
MSNGKEESYANITAVILAGGKGTRLRSAVSDRPKVMAHVLGRPFISYLLDQLSKAGLARVVLSTGYKAEMVSEELGESYGKMTLSYSVEDTPLGTGGGLRCALDLLESDFILVLNGDSFSAFDLGEFLKWFSLDGRDAAIALAKVPDVSRYGGVELNNDGAITSFVEKGAETTGAGLINAGVYLLKRSLIAEIKDGVPFSLERELFPSLINDGERLWGFPFEGEFIDIGTPESYANAESFFSDNQ